jgi:hypothetical protein
VTRAVALALAAVVVGCSGLDEVGGGVVGIEVRVPGPDSLEVGEAIQLTAKPLDKNGDSAAAAVTWVSADPTAAIDPVTGILTGVSPGTARVQATVGALGSGLITFSVVPSLDTLAIVGDSGFTTAPDVVPLPNFVTRLASANPAGPVVGERVIYAVTDPDPLTTTPAVVFMANNLPADTVVTGTDGTATASLQVIPGAVPPDSVVVGVRAQHVRGADVFGSGQRFILRFAAAEASRPPP